MHQLKSILFLLFLSVNTMLAQQYLDQTLAHDGLMREYKIYIPASYDGATAFPLLFNFHGGNDVISSWQELADMSPIADTAGFILVYPQARPDPSDGNSLNWLSKSEGAFDDVPFVSALIDEISSDYQIDQTRIYACGYSLGGEFSYELACKLNDKIAAIGAVARTMQANPDSYCSPIHSTGVLTILGTDDFISPYEGLTWGGIEYYISAAETHNYWINHNGCNPTATLTTISPSVERYTWSTDDGCTYVEELKVIGGGHDWPGVFGNMDIDASQEIWLFVSQYNLDGLIACNSTATVDESKTGIKIYPNPASNQLTIDFIISTPKRYEIFSTVGKLISFGTVGPQNKTIDISGIPSNTYFLKIESEMVKFVKE